MDIQVKKKFKKREPPQPKDHSVNSRPKSSKLGGLALHSNDYSDSWLQEEYPAERESSRLLSATQFIENHCPFPSWSLYLSGIL